MKFSDRLGITKPKSILQLDSMDNDLRNGLWQACIESFFHGGSEHDYAYDNVFRAIMEAIYVDVFKSTTENIPHGYQNGIRAIREWFNKAEWFDVYNFVEFLIQNFDKQPFVDDGAFSWRVFFFLEREKSGYRIVNRLLAPITDPLEIAAVSDAAKLGAKYSNAREHMGSAIALFSQKPNPDYRNSIKEAISAVEAVARVITGMPKATLGEALKELSSKIAIHPSMKEAMNKLYGYTSDASGIRHAQRGESDIDEAEAKFMIVTCSAFVNFCVQRMG
ncbi:hypothetical protein JQ615_01015 [Bradyrhizobium jicamae]|uniref:HEPN AbiJ-N-terminal domain-containing protein n=1 Tax=Bradyrhizobium jicamae TaxID=280332 RepID=A0ABS5FB02_9BRAD|nr:hypothetical protein [Bradyrhizobium jicamae]MBR0793961.1 hypothetical protein [Bradyrhizobium jicamae]